MQQTRHTYVVVVALAGLLYGGTLLDRTAPRVAAVAVASDSSVTPGGVRWEYCALSRAAYAATNRRGVYWISYFKDTGVEVVGVEENVLDQDAALAKTIAGLGEEGWELVGQSELLVRTAKVEALYFKRRKI